MTRAKPSPDRYGRNTTRSFRQSFLTAYASRIGERLSATTESVDREKTAEVSEYQYYEFAAFAQQVQRLRAQHARKPSLLDRFDRAGLK
jgi:hypothetical protein